MLPLLLSIALASAEPGEAPAPAAVPADAPPAPLAIPVAPAAPAPADPTLSSYVPTVLFPIRAANLSSAEVRAAEILFRRRYEVATGQTIADESRVRSAIGESDDKGLHAACLALSCTRWITVDLVRLDTDVYVTAIERDGAAVVTQRVEVVAAGLDAVPDTFDRLARALAGRVPIDSIPVSRRTPAATPTTSPTTAEGVASVGTPVVSTEAAPRRKRTENVPGFKFGILGPLWPGFGVSITHTFTWRRESTDKFLEFAAGFTAPLSLTDDRTFGMVFGEVGLSHVFPSKGGTALYAGGGFGPRIGGYDDLGIGAGVYGQAGVMFGRLTSSRAYLQLKIGGDAFSGFVEPYVVSYAGLETGVGF
ncbi:MAG: hypothetical protein Q8P18_28445 [Pseudomonadota bacterium]|nr:hypothetical protein [Pseudomonadota bacterium]